MHISIFYAGMVQNEDLNTLIFLEMMCENLHPGVMMFGPAFRVILMLT